MQPWFHVLTLPGAAELRTAAAEVHQHGFIYYLRMDYGGGGGGGRCGGGARLEGSDDGCGGWWSRADRWPALNM